jgi:hypothetical protein
LQELDAEIFFRVSTARVTAAGDRSSLRAALAKLRSSPTATNTVITCILSTARSQAPD